MDVFNEEPAVKKSQRNLSLDQLKIPPHSIEAEQSVLGGLMLDNDAWDNVVDKVVEKDFYRHEHRLLFRVMGMLAEKTQPFDVVTISEQLKALGELENAGGEVYLFELSSNTPSVANIKAYADIVHERSVLRQLIAVANEIANQGYHPEGRDVTQLLDEAEQKVFQIAEQGARKTGPEAMKDIANRTLEHINKLSTSTRKITGLATGFADFDKLTSGLQRSDLIVIAGRPSMGKTALAMNFAENVALDEKKPVLMFSMEMPGDSLAMRSISSLGGIEQQRLRSGEINDSDWPRITSAVNMLSGSQMYIDDTPGLTPTDLRARARRLAREKGQLGLIVVDYLQLMHVAGKSENRAVEISEISRSLKALARELKVPLIALSQLNRSLEQRTDRRPMMSDLRESGAIEQDADLIVFIYRDEVYNPHTPEKNVAEIIVGKHRNGPIGRVKLAFRGQFSRFDNFSHSSMEMTE